MKKLLCLLAVLALMAGLFAGCAQSAAPAAEAPAAETPAAEAPAEEAPAAEAPADEPAQEAPAETPAEAPAPAEETESPSSAIAVPEAVQAQGLTYPLDTTETITGWFTCFGFMDSYRTDMEFNNMLTTPYVEEATGVKLDFVTHYDMVATEKFQLMIASGDWPDYSNTVESYYSGGLLQAYEDEVILELEPDFIAENAPLYNQHLTTLSDEDMAYALDDGMYLAVYSIRDQVVDAQNLTTRKDWYDALGVDVHDLDTFTQYLHAIYDTYAPETTLNAKEGGSVIGLNDVFGVTIPSYSASSVPVYVDDGVINTSLPADGYYNYITWFNQLLDEGLIYPEFYNRNMAYDRGADLKRDQMGVWQGNSNSCTVTYKDDGSEIIQMGLTPLTDDGVDDWAAFTSRVSYGFSVFADCPHTELLLNFFDYFFTPEGILLGNYGVEGETYYYDDSGDIMFTELITDDIAGQGVENAIKGYLDEIWPMYEDCDRVWCTYNEYQYAAATLWNSIPTDTGHSYPEAAGLTTSQQDSITNDSADIMTYAATELLSFLTGNVELTQPAWSDYIATMEGMGLNDVLAVYQTAYDEAMAGAR